MIRYLRCLVIFAVAIVAAACTVTRSSSSDAPIKNPQEAADQAWLELSSSGPRPARLAGESPLAYFIREVELSDLRRRELGQKFWERYPNDARRYRWLLLTVHMPPHYPQDIREWSDNETGIGPNKSMIDRSAQEGWLKRYSGMRNVFWKAQEVTAQERRYLWFGELKQKIRGVREAVARGEKGEIKPLLEQIVAYSSANAEPLSELDASEFYECNQYLIDSVALGNGRTLGLDRAVLQWFFDQQAAAGNKHSEGEVLQHRKHLAENDSSEYTRVPEDPRAQAGRYWTALPEYPGDQPSTPESMLIFYHEQVVANRKFRDIGLRLWQEHPDRFWRMYWLKSTQWRSPHYLANFVDGIALLASGKADDVEIDTAARDEWEAVYPKLRATVWDDPATTLQERGQLRAMELSIQLWELQAQWRKTGDKSRVKELLAGIQELYTRYGNASQARQFAGVVFRDASNYGLSDAELHIFLEPMLAYKDENLRTLAEGARRFLQLASGKAAVNLRAPTTQGRQFDLGSMRGKIVLIDYWATTCSSCIGAMPRIKGIYDRYRGKGFEVVSVCFDGAEQRKKVERTEREMGLTWTTLAADGRFSEFAALYGWQGVPQYMLLDREGRLVAGTAEIDMGRNLAALLDEMLAKESAAITVGTRPAETDHE